MPVLAKLCQAIQVPGCLSGIGQCHDNHATKFRSALICVIWHDVPRMLSHTHCANVVSCVMQRLIGGESKLPRLRLHASFVDGLGVSTASSMRLAPKQCIYWSCAFRPLLPHPAHCCRIQPQLLNPRENPLHVLHQSALLPVWTTCLPYHPLPVVLCVFGPRYCRFPGCNF